MLHAPNSVRLRSPAALLFTALAPFLAVGPAAAQTCTYPTLSNGVVATFSTTPRHLRFDQLTSSWAVVAVRSEGTSNWDIGLSLGTAPFAACVTLPVVASQQASGIDFVLGDFAAEGTGTYYAPIARASGSGSATVEWDGGGRTAVVGLGNNNGPATPTLVDCWDVDLVAGQSYRVWLWGDQPGDYTMYALRRGVSNSWRGRADAFASFSSNMSFPHTLTAPVSDRYALVIVRETATPYPYSFSLQPCTDPPDLAHRVSQPIPSGAGAGEPTFEATPAAAGFPTLAVRSPVNGIEYTPEIFERDGSPFAPCGGVFRAASTHLGRRVDLLVGDFASGALTPGPTYDLGAYGADAMPAEGRVEYDNGTQTLTIDAATQFVTGGPDLVVRTFRADLTAGVPVGVHVAKCGVAQGYLYIFRPFDPSNPTNNGWSALGGFHEPVVTYAVLDVQDFGFTPPVTGPYAFVLTNESAENACWELGLSNCAPRPHLPDGVGLTVLANPILAYAGQTFGTIHVRSGWSAVGVRPHGALEDWAVAMYASPSGGPPVPPFGCLSGPLGTTTADATTSRVDLMARYDLNAFDLPQRVATEHVYPVAGASPGGGGVVEFEQWNNWLGPTDLIQYYPTHYNDVLEVWNADLVQGQAYAVHFDAEGFAGEVFVMRSELNCVSGCVPEYQPLGGPFQVLRTSEPTTFVAPATGTYGVIVVNQDGGTGRFSLAIRPTTVDVAPPPAGTPTVTRFRGAYPNPAAASARLAFDLAQPGEVSFEVLDIAGRTVARIPAQAYSAGPGEARWDGRGMQGAVAPAGLYFVRMVVDGRAVRERGRMIRL